MLLQNHEIDGSPAPVKSHGHHHRDAPRHREEVVLCAVYHFSEPEAAMQRLRKKFPSVKFIWHTLEGRNTIDHDGVIPDEDYRSATIFVTFGNSPPSRSHMPNLRFVQLLTSGHDHMRGTPLFSGPEEEEEEEDNGRLAPPVPVATCSGVSARAIAQYVVLQVLSWAHQYPRVRDVMGERRWVGPEKAGGGGECGRGYPMASVLAGKRVGIWGYGSIGRQAARILHAMGMKIIACTSSEKTTPESRRLRGAASLGSISSPAMGDDEGVLPLEWHSGATRAGLHKFLAADLDVLAVFTPLTPSTRHALGREELDILSSSSSSYSSSAAPYLVNVSRGPIVVQDDLVAALRDGRLSGAALDVTDPEPLPADHELWRAPGVSITPHVSWCSAEYVEDCLLGVFEENLGRLLRGDKGGKEGFVNQIR